MSSQQFFFMALLPQGQSCLSVEMKEMELSFPPQKCAETVTPITGIR